MPEQDMPEIVEEEAFRPNRRNDFVIVGVSLAMLFFVSLDLARWQIGGALLRTLFKMPILFVLLAIAYFITQRSGKWHLLYMIFVLIFLGYLASQI